MKNKRELTHGVLSVMDGTPFFSSALGSADPHAARNRAEAAGRPAAMGLYV